MSEKKSDSNEFDIFIANSIFPDPVPLFLTSLKPVEEIKDSALIVLDTNALLVPYSIGKDSLTQIEKTYKKVVKTNQLRIPGQVAREFAVNRASKILEVFQQLSQKKKNASGLQKGSYPLLESIPEYQAVVTLEKKIDTQLREYKTKIDNVLEQIRSWTWNDPVSSIYAGLFGEQVVFDPPIDRDVVKAELSRRQLHHIPPGYKDGSKDDSGVGDYLIWLSIVELGKSSKKDLIFVSGDQKADWWYRTENQAIYPRYELVDEYRRETGGFSFQIIPFSRFLDLFGASETTVEEVREEENRLWTDPGLVVEFTHRWRVLQSLLQEIYSEHNSDKPQQGAPFSLILRWLYRQGLIDGETIDSVEKLRRFRNTLMHDGPRSFTDEVIRERTHSLNAIIVSLDKSRLRRERSSDHSEWLAELTRIRRELDERDVGPSGEVS